MVSIKSFAEAKSDQINATDILGIEKHIKIREVRFFPEKIEQPLEIFYHGENVKCWRVSKGMARVLIKFWGDETDNWINREVILFCDETVTFGKEKTGGIRIKALSNIDNATAIRVPYARMRYKDYLIEKIESKTIPEKITNAIKEMQLMIESMVDISEITSLLESTKYQHIKSKYPELIIDIDEKLQTTQNEINGVN